MKVYYYQVHKSLPLILTLTQVLKKPRSEDALVLILGITFGYSIQSVYINARI
jgi:hypothetical protein